MSTQGPNAPGTAAIDATVGTVDWVLPNNVLANDNIGTTAALNGGLVSKYLVVTGFGHTIPSGSTINGIQFNIKRKNSGSGDVEDNSIRLTYGGTFVGTDKASALPQPWATSYETVSPGGPADTWGVTPSVADVNASDYGIAISGYATSGLSQIANLDYVESVITYTSGTSVRTSSMFLVF